MELTSYHSSSLNSAYMWSLIIAFTLPWQWSYQEVLEYVPNWDLIISDDDDDRDGDDGTDDDEYDDD